MDPIQTIAAPEKAKIKPTATQPAMATMSLNPFEARKTVSKQEEVLRLRGGYCGYYMYSYSSNEIDAAVARVVSVAPAAVNRHITQKSRPWPQC